MLRKLALLGGLFSCCLAFGQTAARYDLPALMTTPGGSPSSALPALLAVKNATVSVCGYPAVLSNGMCTNTITTYTDASKGTACPSTAQLTMPGSSSCVSQTDLQGNLGFWYDPSAQSHVTYTVKTSWGTYGPYDVSNPNATGCAVSGCTMTGPLDVASTSHLPLGCVSAKSPVCGAKGDGTTDDTNALNTCISYAVSHAMTNTGSCMYLPAGRYLVTKALNATMVSGIRSGLRIVGDGKQASVIEHALTEAYPVLDMGGDTNGGLENISIKPATIWGGASSLATAALFVSAGANVCNQGANNFHLEHVDLEGGTASTHAAAVLYDVDLPSLHDMSINGDGGAGLVLGDGMGTATAVTSKFYTVPSCGNQVTIAKLDRMTVIGNAPSLQLTGNSGEYDLDNTYVALSNSTAAGPIVKVSGCTGCSNSLHGNLRTENNTSVTGVNALEIDTSMANTALQFTPNNTNNGTLIAGSGAISQSDFTVNGGGGTAVTVFGITGSLSTSTVRNGSSYTSYGTIASANNDVLYSHGALTPASVLSAVFPAGASGVSVYVDTKGWANSDGLTIPNPPSTGALITTGCASSACSSWSGVYYFMFPSYKGAGDYDVGKYYPQTGGWVWTSGSTTSNGGSPDGALQIFGSAQSWGNGTGGFGYQNYTNNFYFGVNGSGQVILPSGQILPINQYFLKAPLSAWTANDVAALTGSGTTAGVIDTGIAYSSLCLSDGTHCSANASVTSFVTTPAWSAGGTMAWSPSGSIASLEVTATHGTTSTLNLGPLTNNGKYVVVVYQDATGGGTTTLNLGTGCTWGLSNSTDYSAGSSVTVTATANHFDVLSFTYDGTTCIASWH